jgi:hypothetical protein
MLVATLAVPSVFVLTIMSFTSVGAHRRGAGPALSVLAGICFPVTWTVWYLRDTRLGITEQRQRPARVGSPE